MARWASSTQLRRGISTFGITMIGSGRILGTADDSGRAMIGGPRWSLLLRADLGAAGAIDTYIRLLLGVDAPPAVTWNRPLVASRTMRIPWMTRTAPPASSRAGSHC